MKMYREVKNVRNGTRRYSLCKLKTHTSKQHYTVLKVLYLIKDILKTLKVTIRAFRAFSTRQWLEQMQRNGSEFVIVK